MWMTAPCRTMVDSTGPAVPKCRGSPAKLRRKRRRSMVETAPPPDPTADGGGLLGSTVSGVGIGGVNGREGGSTTGAIAGDQVHHNPSRISDTPRHPITIRAGRFTVITYAAR